MQGRLLPDNINKLQLEYDLYRGVHIPTNNILFSVNNMNLPSDFDEQQRGLYLYLKEDYDEWNNSWGANDYRNLH